MPEWTKEQQQAINHHGHDILVSASAGSGKTTILIERIIEMIKQGENVDNLLVATFTEAAAAEMKDRLVNRLKDLANDGLIKNVLRKHIQKQIFKTPVANISTLHAFCLSIIKKFYYIIDLDPNFRLLSDDTEKSIIQDQALDNVRNKYYENHDKDYLKLVDNFSNDRSDDGLTDIIYQLYNFAITNDQTDKWLDQLTNIYTVEEPINNSNFYKLLYAPQILRKLDQIKDLLDSGLDIAVEDPASNTYTPVFQDMTTKIEKIAQDVKQNVSYDDVREEVFNLSFTNKKRAPKDFDPDPDRMELLKDIRKTLGDKVTKNLVNNFFLLNEQDTLKEIKKAKSLIVKLVEVERNFMKEFSRLKNRQQVLDFNDLEHMAMQILSTEVNGTKTALKFYQNKFHEIMLDEYQDINAMQEGIIQLLKTDDNNIFMVGDIKQSIYGFRQAAPYIFAGKYEDFQKEDNPNELIQLSKNFRSSEQVDDLVNTIFTRIFDKNIGEINYDEQSKLIVGTNFPKEVDTDSEMYVLTNEDEINKVERRQSQIQFAAKRIQKLITSKFKIFDAKKGEVRDIKYSDIAILVRNRNNNTDLISYFAKSEIPLMVTDAQNYFQTTELQIMMSMLEIVDNPRQDIPLVAVLRSPIVGLNEEELAQIRLVNKNEDYYTAVIDYIADDKSQPNLVKKLQSFLLQLETYRDFSNKNTIARLIWKIYQETAILEYVSGMPGGKQRSANLHALYQRASDYENNNLKGLHAFIDFIQRMEKMDKDLSQPNSIEATDDTVKVMTIHASKGLEFPVVILLDAGGAFNMRDVNSETLFDAELGLGLTVLNNQTRVAIKTLQHSIISEKRRISTVSEEMRLLYVALTRAKQKLIIISYEKDSQKMLNKWDQIKLSKKGVVDDGSRLAATNYQNLIGMGALNSDQRIKSNTHTSKNTSCRLNFDIIFDEALDKNNDKGLLKVVDVSEPSALFKQTVDSILNFNYPYQESVETTAYQSVSEIKGLFEDPDEDKMAQSSLLSDSGRYNMENFAKPKFLAQTKVSSADVGSATHLVLQQISIDETPKLADFKNLINDLVNERIIEPEVAKRIDITSLSNFYQSTLGQEIVANNQHVSREVPFSSLMPAKKLFKKKINNESFNDKILVHGIIDGVIELEDGIKIFDYKTDNVTSQNLTSKVKDYSGQLNLYAQAISTIKNKPILGKYLYFLKINEMVDLNKN
ncbi:helicase-exonuclease AddAB subunit AddA [Companilactobacillus baiquanensis]|uniref:ATP-dependent helicase/nuclease subunit A n=1 Tax=Companilactobacillus baiquanensis TaxID=2486005 RepID=A0ABW1UWU7_9LACO|nr:helicase-exonuclease AddAB subunit AddA [Companilactobacillus baiquanensis]